MLFRKMAGKAVTKDGKTVELFLDAKPGVQEYIKGLILQCFAQEPSSNVRHKIGDAIAELARQIIENGMETATKIKRMRMRRIMYFTLRIFPSDFFLQIRPGTSFFPRCLMLANRRMQATAREPLGYSP